VLETWFSLMSTIRNSCKPFKKSKIPRYMVDIDGELVVIDGVVDVNICAGCISRSLHEALEVWLYYLKLVEEYVHEV
jgi:hypothetical protein